MTTFNAYIPMVGSDELPEVSGLTRSEIIHILPDLCEHQAIDTIIHIKTDGTWENVADEIFAIVYDGYYERNIDSTNNMFGPTYLKGTLGALCEDHDTALYMSQSLDAA